MFLIGDKILHPMLGAGVIDEIVTQKVSGVTREYYVMHVSVGSMKVMIPVASCGEIGVRPVLSAREADEVIASLAALHVEDTANWNRRYRENMLRIKSGDILQVAQVVKSLALREREHGLSTGERKMLSSARQIFYSELVLSKNATLTEIEALVSHALSREN